MATDRRKDPTQTRSLGAVTPDLRVSLHKLDVFCRVVETASVTRAAGELHLSQPVVTAHVRALEDRFGAKLLHRERDGMYMTEAGELVYSWARNVIADGVEVWRRINDQAEGRSGRVVVGASMAIGCYVLPGLLPSFQRAYPDATVSVIVAEESRVAAALEQGVADVGFMLSAPASLNSVPLMNIECVLVGSSRSSTPDQVTTRELSSLAWIGLPFDHPDVLVHEELARCGVTLPAPHLELGQPEAIKRAIAADLGVAIFTAVAVHDELTAGTLKAIRIVDMPMLAVRLNRVQQPGKVLTLLQAEFVRHVQEALVP